MYDSSQTHSAVENILKNAGHSSVRSSPDALRLPAGTKIAVRDISKVFRTRAGKIVALEHMSFMIREGEFVCVVGPSGCGKTTLLRILAGLERQTAGKVYIVKGDNERTVMTREGSTISRDSRPLTSIVFQEQSVFPWLTVKQNVEYGLRMRGVPGEERSRIADHYIKMIGLAEFANAYPHQLSGGMKQRTSVARAFANDPEILLLDEPFGALDEQNRVLLQQELLRIWEGSRKTAIFITHSIDEALILGDRVIIMTARPGTVKAIVDVDLPRPRQVTDLKSQPAFLDLFRTIWGQLSEEVLKTRELERSQKDRARTRRSDHRSAF
ncbi:MAG TPA: ABC transporter ATP-binding protein [Firmicutes bacterium]|nr:ABC transporter ATP-binding protein [Bacillota bacterium]